MGPSSRTLSGLALLGLILAASACGGSTSQGARDVSQTGGRGDAKDSLFRAANLRVALDRVRRRAGPAATVTALKLEAGALTLVVRKGATAESVVVTKRRSLRNVPAPAAADQPPIALAALEAAGPERIAAAIGRRTGTGLRDIDFFALDHEPGVGTPRWLVYLRRGRGTFAASLSGADVEPVSATPTAPSPQTSPPTTTPPTPTPPTR